MKHAFAHDYFDLFHECAAVTTENIKLNLESYHAAAASVSNLITPQLKNIAVVQGKIEFLGQKRLTLQKSLKLRHVALGIW